MNNNTTTRDKTIRTTTRCEEQRSCSKFVNSNHFEIAFNGQASIMIRAPTRAARSSLFDSAPIKAEKLFTDQPLSVKKFKSLFAGILISKYCRAFSLLLTIHCRISRCRIVGHVYLVSLFPVFQLCCLPEAQADLQNGSRFWRRGQQPSSTTRPVALLWQGFEPNYGVLTSLLS